MIIGWRATARHEQYKNFDRKLSSLMTVKMSTTTTAQLVSNTLLYVLNDEIKSFIVDLDQLKKV